MLKPKIGRGISKDFETALNEATKEFINPKLIIYYTSKSNFETFSRLLMKRFSKSIIIGCSAYKEICKDGLTNGALLVAGFEDGIECSAGVIGDIDKYPVKYIQNIQDSIASLSDPDNAMCLEFCVGTTNSEEKVLSTINSLLNVYGIPLFGGTSADDGEFKTTYVGLNGKVYTNHCVFVLIKNLNGKIKLYKENIFKPTKNNFIATKVNLRQRIVYELDGKPCAEVMANNLNVPLNNLPDLFGAHPLGRVVGNDIFISANKNLIDNKAISCYSRIYKNSQITLLEPDDYRQVLKTTIAKILSDFNHISFSLVINCVARTMLFESENFADTFAKELGKLGNYIGFASHGEQMYDYHFNQTMIIAVFE
ncbi:FIST signal transduction protein [Clostridium neuense]|uniref:FIST signal transduction protein n=1 Tax=Clostridium neuense TaxID=1728934 RepID=A0ABW8TKW2_9CLOT